MLRFFLGVDFVSDTSLRYDMRERACWAFILLAFGCKVVLTGHLEFWCMSVFYFLKS